MRIFAVEAPRFLAAADRAFRGAKWLVSLGVAGAGGALICGNPVCSYRLAVTFRPEMPAFVSCAGASSG
jgi:hypothetical protein